MTTDYATLLALLRHAPHNDDKLVPGDYIVLRDALIRIAREYPQAIREPLERHPLAAFIRGELPRALADLIHSRPGFEDVIVEGTKLVGTGPVKWKYFDPSRRISPESVVTGH